MKNYAHYLQPLYAFAASSPKNRPLSWKENLQNDFTKSQEALAQATLLSFPDPKADTELVVDASGFCIGAVLQQIQHGSPQPLAFWSKTLTETQKSWSAFDRELYACFSSIKHFCYFLDSHQYVLKTDHKPVVHKFYSNTIACSRRQ